MGLAGGLLVAEGMKFLKGQGIMPTCRLRGMRRERASLVGNLLGVDASDIVCRYYHYTFC